jgi:hypothetical protein
MHVTIFPIHQNRRRPEEEYEVYSYAMKVASTYANAVERPVGQIVVFVSGCRVSPPSPSPSPSAGSFYQITSANMGNLCPCCDWR